MLQQPAIDRDSLLRRFKGSLKIVKKQAGDTEHEAYDGLASAVTVRMEPKCNFDMKYELGDKIGEGAHGIVRKCTHLTSGKVHAVKIVPLDDQHIFFLKRNFAAIRHLSHSNVIRYKALYFDMQKHVSYLVMEYLPIPSLLHVHIESESHLRHIIRQLVEVLKYIHENAICHRDIKPDNVLYNEEERKIKLIDFGVSKQTVSRDRRKQMISSTGTLLYRAPQMFMGGGYDETVDEWALGVTIYKLVTGSTPFQNQYVSDTIANIQAINPQFGQPEWRQYSPLLKNFVSRLLRKRQERVLVKDIHKEPWFIVEEFHSAHTDNELDNQYSHTSNSTFFQPLTRLLSSDYTSDQVFRQIRERKGSLINVQPSTRDIGSSHASLKEEVVMQRWIKDGNNGQFDDSVGSEEQGREIEKTARLIKRTSLGDKTEDPRLSQP